MKLFFDFFPIFLFFIAYKLWDIYIATAIAIVASILQLLAYWFIQRRFERMHCFSLVAITLLGGATLLFANEIFIKWKPTVLYWLLALIFFGSHFIGKKVLIQQMLENNLQLPATMWQKLNMSWTIFFAIIGTINLYIIYHYSTNTWVNFKLFGVLGLTLLFALLQGVVLAKYMVTQQDSEEKY